MKITLNLTNYEIATDNYEGDIILMNLDGGPDRVIAGGYGQLKREANEALGIWDRVTGAFESEKSAREDWVQANLYEFVEKNFATSAILDND